MCESELRCTAKLEALSRCDSTGTRHRDEGFAASNVTLSMAVALTEAKIMKVSLEQHILQRLLAGRRV